MKRRGRLIPLHVALAFLLLPGSAVAGTVIVPEGTQPYQQWVDEARVPTPPAKLTMIYTEGVLGCPQNEAFACTDGYSTIWIGDTEPRINLYHELGHVFEFVYLRDDPAVQQRIGDLIGHSKMRWARWGTLYGLGSLNEAFAMAYAQCARLARIAPRYYYTLGRPLIAGWRLKALCRLLRTY